VSEHDNSDAVSDGLRRLFDDERLAIATAPGARESVVAGARRVRRRRELTVIGGGTMAAVAALAAGVLLAMPPAEPNNPVAAPEVTSSISPGEITTSKPPPSSPAKERGTPGSVGPGRSGEGPSSGGQRPARSPEAPSGPPLENAPAAGGGPIGPNGYGGLTLGMSFEQAQADGWIASDAPAPGGCTSYQLLEGTDSVQSVLISESGLGRITASGGRTPEGMGSGASIEALMDSYPDGSEQGGEFVADSGAGSYHFPMGEDAIAHGLYLTNGGC
jgi:hypothetical protein